MHEVSDKPVSIGELDITAIREEFAIAEPSLPWKPQYDPYQNGGWFTCSLMNPAGLSDNNVIADGIARPTELMFLFPTLARLLENLTFKVMWVRLAKMAPDAMLWEHIDYTELNSKKKYRLHIPLLSNKDACLILPGQAVHLPSGNMWLIDPKNRHAAVNRGSTSRVHLLLDLYLDQKLEEMIGKAKPLMEFTQLPKLDCKRRKDLLERASRLLELGFIGAAERLLLRSFLFYDLGEVSSYDLLIDLYTADSARGQHWNETKKVHLGIN